ncbi:FG-GAP repeat domain-containing protein [Luteolibacter sp. AS25]|uniref:FG-GAP repeat domain-containing protein n=1 Tax=Luteolibacter sp. AS25 TaxID=3135776 RepID=UPI00398A750C
MKTYQILIPCSLLALLIFAQSTAPPQSEGSWERKQLTDNFWAEGAAAGDVDKDGAIDLVYGPYWFAGPDFENRHTIYPDKVRTKTTLVSGGKGQIEGFHGAKSKKNGYSDNFAALMTDVNADGWEDYLVAGFPGKETFWYENPQGAEGLWKRRVALDVTENESPMFVDVDGDGQVDLLCMRKGVIGYASFDAETPEEPWAWHPVSPNNKYMKFTHGLGAGDVNGDGRNDILEGHGWWEQPESLEGDPVWEFHPQQFREEADKPNVGGAQMFAYDVNGDGLNDVITALNAHGYGLAWFEQKGDGWVKHLITGTPDDAGGTGVVFSQPHALEMKDMNGDGVEDIVTGKRFWAHGSHGDPESNAPALVLWFELKRDGKEATFVPHLIDADSGVGTQVFVGDLNGDGKADVFCGNKRGAFVHLQK